MEKAYPTVLPGPSARTIVLNGIAVTVYGLEELSASTTEVACVWLLHPRLCTQAYMQPIAASLIKHWHENFYSPKHRSRLLRRGLIAISFDQRNHGTRERDSLCNLTWADGNPNHAVDMYTIYREYFFRIHF